MNDNLILISNVTNLVLYQLYFFFLNITYVIRSRLRLDISLSIILKYFFRIRSLMFVRTSLLWTVIYTSSRYYKSNGVKISTSKTGINVVLYVFVITRRYLFYTSINLVVSIFISRSSLERCYITITYVITDFITVL